MKVILVGLMTLVSLLASAQGQDQDLNPSCVEQIVSSPYCVDIFHAEIFCDDFGVDEELFEQMKQNYHGLVEKGFGRSLSTTIVFGTNPKNNDECEDN
jgi:hypothetical protein